MPQSPGSPSELTSADFGANEWLVEEMYDQYQRDPNSVDPTWKKYFQANGAVSNSSGAGATNGTTHTAPQSKSAQSKPAQGTPATAKPAAPVQEHKPDPTPTPAPVAKPRPESKAAEPAKGTTSPVPKESRPAARRPAPPRTWTPR